MKLGLIGFGYWGKKVFDEYHNLLKEGKIEKLMVFDSNAEVSNFIPSYIKFADSVGEVVENSDLLHVCSPNNTHYELGVKILTEGKHLLMEKPLTTNSLRRRAGCPRLRERLPRPAAPILLPS